MTPLLQALTDAAKVGLDGPKCAACYGNGSNFSGHLFDDIACKWCHATGLDASDPERLIGRAMVWLESEMHQVTFTQRVALSRNLPNTVQTNHTTLGARKEHHDGTPTGFATALLRLVARVGAPHPQTAPETRETETA
jgi:hypothetical protein